MSGQRLLPAGSLQAAAGHPPARQRSSCATGRSGAVRATQPQCAASWIYRHSLRRSRGCTHVSAAAGSGSGTEGGGGSRMLVPAANNCVPVPSTSPVAISLPPAAGAIASESRSTSWEAAGHGGGVSSGSHGGRAAAGAVAEAAAPAAPQHQAPPCEEGDDNCITGVSDEMQEEIDQAVHIAFEQEIENINQAVHEAFELEMTEVKQEMEQINLDLNQTVTDAVETAVETALLDRTFDIKANLNTMVALTGVILYWRGIWNLFDDWLGTDNFAGNLGSVFIGLSVILLFRIFKLPLAEFW